MKLTAELAGEKHEIEMKREGARLNASIDGRRYELEAREQGAGVYLLLAGNRVFECRVDQSEAQRGRMEVHVGGDTHAVTLADPKRLRGAQLTGTPADGRAAQIVAPMPGKVVRVLVQQGAQVAAGDGILVVEAMKMQNEMKSSRAGTVTELHAAAGQTVKAGEILAVIE
ncbi:MAG TPA: biotin/lipoyl-containing protein [Pyrinomonadaceae bacterium]|nr:biotin/lipoyl-containing protein [Pyrinomonadaceae bacterium]